MKRIILIIMILVLSWHQALCEGGSIMETECVNIIEDPLFVNGASVVSPAKPMRYVGRIKLSDEGNETPSWLLTQWNSRNNIMRIPLMVNDGVYTYENEFKTVSREPDGTLTLRVNGAKEYTRTRTALIDPWVHLYMEQRYYDTPKSLEGAMELRLNTDFCIPFFENCTPEGEYNPNLHAVIAVFYLTVEDTNPESPSLGQYINFCVMLYDNRTGITREETHMDSGQNPIDATNMLVYTMDSSVYATPVFADGVWHTIDVDLWPYIQKALSIAQRQGCMIGTRKEDLAIRSVFFGFEVPGVMNCEMKIRNPQLTLVRGLEK